MLLISDGCWLTSFPAKIIVQLDSLCEMRPFWEILLCITPVGGSGSEIRKCLSGTSKGKRTSKILLVHVHFCDFSLKWLVPVEFGQ